MKTNNFDVPSEIFTWIEKKGFEELSAAERKEVLLYFTPEEYSDMNLAASLLMGPLSEKAGTADISKQVLLSYYDQKHGKGTITKSLFRRRVEVWKIAAALSPIILGFLVFSFFRSETRLLNQPLAVTDTLYIKEKSVEQVIVHDTVYRNTGKKPERSDSFRSAPLSEKPEAGTEESLGVLSIDELRGEANMVRGNSMEDDSLWRKFPQVSL
jgi:hypothetical protein